MRYVKPVDSSEELTRLAYRLSILFAIPLTLLVITSILPNAGLVFMVGKIDPALLDHLREGSVVAYVSATTGFDPRQYGIDVVDTWFFGKMVIYKVMLESYDELETLARDERVISVYGYQPAGNMPLYWLDPSIYPFRDIDIDNIFHEATSGWRGCNVTIAIIDTGLDYTHPDFFEADGEPVWIALVSTLYLEASTRLPLVWLPGVNGTIEDLLAFDSQIENQYGEPAFLDKNGHGTHVAGIAVGRGWASNGKYIGIAPCAKLVMIKSFTSDGRASLDALLEALEWVYNNSEHFNIKVLSMSWGAAYASDGRDPLSLAVERIVLDKNVIAVAAAGNMGNIPTTVVVPAVAPHVIAVGAWDPYFNRLAPFSSLGPTIDLRMKPDVAAAGVMIVAPASTFVNWPQEYMVGDYYVALSGTSMATPVVAGIAARFVEYYRYWYGKDPTPQDFMEWLEKHCRRIFVAKDFVTGWGIPVAPHSQES